jgi:hypothetical protein
MQTGRERLADVLAGQPTNRAEIGFLHLHANAEESVALDVIESRLLMEFVPRVISGPELIFRSLRRPQAPLQKAATAVERARLEDILDGKQSPTSAELQSILQSRAAYTLSAEEVELLETYLRQARYSEASALREAWRCEEPHTCRTPYEPLLDCDEFDDIERRAEAAIARCSDHRAPNCACWLGARDWLWNTRKQYPDKSPEGWYASHLWAQLEEAERTLRKQ